MAAAFDREFAEAFLTALYRTLLLREPDTDGLAANLDLFLDKNLSLEEMIERMLCSAEFTSRARLFLYRYTSEQDLPFTNEVSQHGEVFFLLRQMVNAAARHRIVVDVGARGRDRSNSYDLLKHFAWRGLLIEANPALIASIRRDFADLDFELLNVAVSDYKGKNQLFFGINEDVSSLSRDAVEKWGESTGCVAIEVARLGDILQDFNIPEDFDVLSIDIEGEDIKVINDMVENSPYRPRWIIIEVPPLPDIRSLDDLPFGRAVIDAYVLMGRLGPNLLLQFLK